MEAVLVALVVGVVCGVGICVARGGRPHGRARGVVMCAALAVTLAACDSGPTRTVVMPAPVDAGLSIYTIGPGGLTAYRAGDGAVRWTDAPADPYMTDGLPPMYDAGLVFGFTWHSGDATHATLTAVRASDGQPAWHLRVPGFPPPLAVGGGYAVVELQGSTLAEASLLVLRAADGAQVSEFALQGGASAFAVDGGQVYACPADGFLYAYGLSDGKQLWRVSVAPTSVAGGGPEGMGLDLSCFPRAMDGTIYTYTPTPEFGPPASLLAIRESDGHLLWHAELAGAPPVEHDGTVYVVARSQPVVAGIPPYPTPSPTIIAQTSFTLVALRARDGAALWRIPGLPDTVPTIITAGSVVVFAQGADLWAVSAADGADIWQHHEPNHYADAIMAANGVVFALSYHLQTFRGLPPPGTDFSDYLIALHASDGSVYWQIPIAMPAGITLGGAST